MIVIGGIGGSGTRVPALIMQKLGYDFGLVNYACDSMQMRHFYSRWVNKEISDEMLGELEIAIANQAITHKNGPLAIKNPNSIHFLQAFDTVSDLKFVHVIRNGAYLAQKYEKKKHLGQEKENFLDFWEKVNKKAFFYGKTMENRYLLLRYEDLCFGKGLNRFLDFLEAKIDPNSIRNVIIPQTRENPHLFHKGLAFFGY